MSAGFYPLPSTFPSAEALYLLRYLRGQPWDLPETLHAAWSLAGYAQVHLSPVPAGDGSPGGTLANTGPLANPSFSLEESLALIANPPRLPVGASAAALGIDWKALLKAVIEQILSKLLG